MLLNRENKKMFIYLLVMTILIAFGFQGWRTVFNNYSVEIINITGQQMGILQSVREIPGFLALLVIYVLLFIKEHRLAALSLIVLGVGITITGVLNSFYGLIISTLIMSFGFHYYETVNQSLVLQYFDNLKAPLVITKLKSIGAITNIAVCGAIFFIARFLDYTQIFILIGLVVIIGAIWCLFQNPTSQKIPVQHKKMIFKKQYWLYYVLTFLSGARRQIFIAFAVFLLISKFKFSIFEITGLFILNNLINYFFMPYIGKLINKKGERFMLSIEYGSLFFIFLAYIIINSKIFAGAVYILDHIFFGFAIAIQTYFKKNADPQDIAPSMAVGFTINHIAAVILPTVGGMLWMISYKIPFILGAALSICSLIFVQFIKTGQTEESPLIKEEVLLKPN